MKATSRDRRSSLEAITGHLAVGTIGIALAAWHLRAYRAVIDGDVIVPAENLIVHQKLKTVDAAEEDGGVVAE